MFETATLSNGPASRRFWHTCVGFAGEALLLGCAVLAPILSPQILPRAMFATLVAAPGAPPPPPAMGAVVHPRVSRPAPRLTSLILTQPARVPNATPIIVDPPQIVASIGVPGSTGTGSGDGVRGGILSDILDAGNPTVAPPRVIAPAPAPETRTAPPSAPIRIRVGSGVRMAETIFRPEPPYPAIARQARVSGTVELVGVIGTDGHLRELRIVSGHPMLARAALEAVSRWIYQPTLLNGEPVEVIAPITVTFRLN
ncbi:MAG TPA: energy transducer TonB [Bryobacteraceae bacterium]